jgi:predicted ATPase
MKGELSGSGSCLTKALTIAQEQNARSLQLRAALSLARMGRSPEALADAYGWFTEGFRQRDLVDARAFLARAELV